MCTLTASPKNAGLATTCTLRHEWHINSASVNDGASIGRGTFTGSFDITEASASYTWDRVLNANDIVFLGFYSNDTSTGSPTCVGSTTWYLEDLDE